VKWGSFAFVLLAVAWEIGCENAGSKQGAGSKDGHTGYTAPGERIPVSGIVEAACGPCQFDRPGKTCTLAVRIEGQSYFVEGSSIDDHGDAHAADGMCAVVRKAQVEGYIEKDKFVATSFKLLPVEDEKTESQKNEPEMDYPDKSELEKKEPGNDESGKNEPK
jgi:hypothetical protein